MEKYPCVDHALQCTARNNASGYIKASKAVPKHFSVDNYLDSVESPLNRLTMSEEMLRSQSRWARAYSTVLLKEQSYYEHGL